jgi:phage-related protein
MADIYTTNNWAASTQYLINDFVINGNYYYYCLKNHTSSSNFSTDLSDGDWGGVLTYGGRTLPQFIWKPSYNFSLDIKPAIKTIQFSDGYKQILRDGISNILLPFNLQFEDRSLKEITAILHFLHARSGSDKFYWIPPAPWNVVKIFSCPQWTPTQRFYENYALQTTFQEEVV